MVKFLTTLEISAQIEKIIKEAREKLILMSPYLKMNKIFYDRLKDANDKGIRITFIYGKQELIPNQREQLNKLESLEIYYCEDLHAKCYCNEGKMVITSLNLLDFSQSHNREMGILIKRQGDWWIYYNTFMEIISIIKSSNIEKLSRIHKSNSQSMLGSWNDILEMSCCIRCGKWREFTADPYCKQCYFEWKNAEYPNIIENFCMGCGKPYESTFEKPLCEYCYHNNF